MICSRSLGAFALAVGILIASGCARMRAALPWSHTEIDLSSMAADTAAYFPDTSAVASIPFVPETPADTTAVVVRPVRERREPPPPPPVVVTTPPDTAAVEPQTPPPTISVAIPERQRIRLESAYRADVAAADSLRSEIATRVTTTQGKEKLLTVGDLLIQARAAMEAQNLEAAANLAHKARLLAQELLPR